jgi:integrase
VALERAWWSIKEREGRREGGATDEEGKDDALASFRYAIPAKGTEKDSITRLGYFFNFLDIPAADGDDNNDDDNNLLLNKQASNFLAQIAANPNPKYGHDCLFKYSRHLKGRFDRKELKSGTLRNYLFAPKLFYEVNEIKIDWRQIKRGLPAANYIAHDRAITSEEIRKLIAYPDRRVKIIVLIIISSGIRVGAFDYLKLKHVIPITKNEEDKEESSSKKEEPIAAKLIVYAGETEEHITFITPEAYQTIQEYMEFRKLHGEKITPDSWLIRDKFLTTSDRHAANKSMPTNPQKCQVEAIKKLIQRALEVQGVRPPLKENEHRHEFKSTHGLRKYFKTKTVAAGMHPLNVELLMDHKTGLENNYYRPDEQALQDDYLKAVDFLTINTERKEAIQLRKEVAELAEKNEESNYVIKGKLAERETQVQELAHQLEMMRLEQGRRAEELDRKVEKITMTEDQRRALSVMDRWLKQEEMRERREGKPPLSPVDTETIPVDAIPPEFMKLMFTSWTELQALEQNKKEKKKL